MTEADEIARGLTKEERRILLTMVKQKSGCALRKEENMEAAYSLEEKGLLSRVINDGFGVRIWFEHITDLGRSVAQAIEKGE